MQEDVIDKLLLISNLVINFALQTLHTKMLSWVSTYIRFIWEYILNLIFWIKHNRFCAWNGNGRISRFSSQELNGNGFSSHYAKIVSWSQWVQLSLDVLSRFLHTSLSSEVFCPWRNVFFICIFCFVILFLSKLMFYQCIKMHFNRLKWKLWFIFQIPWLINLIFHSIQLEIHFLKMLRIICIYLSTTKFHLSYIKNNTS